MSAEARARGAVEEIRSQIARIVVRIARGERSEVERPSPDEVRNEALCRIARRVRGRRKGGGRVGRHVGGRTRRGFVEQKNAAAQENGRRK
jgi:hypothetical protein